MDKDLNKDGLNFGFDDLKKQFNEIFGSSIGKINLMPVPIGEDVRQQQQDDQATNEFLEKIKNFNLKPREIKSHLDRFVIKQDEAKKVLSVAICDHFNHIKRCLNDPKSRDKDYNKQNVLILGPTGVGKTYLIKNIAKLIGVPFAKVDATKFSETGYIGNDVDEMIRDLVRAADGNADIAQYGIVFIDEIDKIASSGGSDNRDVSGRGVQINLLKLMEESEVSLFSQTDVMSQLKAVMSMGDGKKKSTTINTKHILFIASGAFDKLTNIIKSRIGRHSIGFAAGIQNVDNLDGDEMYDLLRQADTADFIKFGFEPEFAGRLPVRVACEQLKANDLREILVSSEGSILKQYIDDFAGYGIKLSILDDAVDEIAKRASKEQTGARGLLTILEKIFRCFKFELPSTDIHELIVDKQCVDDPQQEIQKLLNK